MKKNRNFIQFNLNFLILTNSGDLHGVFGVTLKLTADAHALSSALINSWSFWNKSLINSEYLLWISNICSTNWFGILKK